MGSVFEDGLSLPCEFRFSTQPSFDVSMQVVRQTLDGAGSLASVVRIESARNSKRLAQRYQTLFNFGKRVSDSVMLHGSEVPGERHPRGRQIAVRIAQFVDVFFPLDAVREVLADAVKIGSRARYDFVTGELNQQAERNRFEDTIDLDRDPARELNQQLSIKTARQPEQFMNRLIDLLNAQNRPFDKPALERT